MKKILAILLISSVVVAGCKNGCSSKDNDQTETDSTNNINLGELPDSLRVNQELDSTQVAARKDSSLTGLTKEVLTIFKNKDYTKLDSLIHPNEGIRFSPYATVLSSDKKFSREAFNKMMANKNKKVNWGSYDGSGDPIYLTPTEYFKKFVYDANFLTPEKYDINNFIKTGNSVNNLKSEYENAEFTESHFSGSKKNGGIDWKSVRLVFKQIGGKYYLVGVVHDGWTI